MPQSVVVIYGPSGCGKTNAAEELRDYYCEGGVIVDNWAPGDNQEIPDNALVLTQKKPTVNELLSIGEDAIAINFVLAIEELYE